MNVISIGTDRKLFEEGSGVRARMIDQGALFTSLHIIVYTREIQRFEAIRIADNVWIYPTNSLSKLSYARDAVSLAKKIATMRKFTSQDTVVTAQDPFDTGLAGMRIKKKLGFKLQIQVHTDFLSPYFARESLLNRWRVRVSKKILRSADEIRVVSERIKRSLSTYTIPEQKIDILPIFIDTKKFDGEPTANLHTKYHQFNFIVLMASRLTREKNIMQALHIFAEVANRYPKAGLIIVGEGPEQEDLERRARLLGLRNNIIFEPWQSDITSYLKTANVFLLTSIYEGFGMTLIEAGLAKLPIVTSDVGCAEDIIRDGENSFICPVNDTKCFVSKITKIVEDNSVRNLFSHRIAEDAAHAIIADKGEYLAKYKALLEKTLTTTT